MSGAPSGAGAVLPVIGEDSVASTVDSVREIAATRARRELTGADRWSAHLLGWGYVGISAWLAVADRGHISAWVGSGSSAGLVLLTLVGSYALAHRTEFEAAGGSAVPTEPVLVAMLLVLPLGLVPLAVLAAQQIGSIGQRESEFALHRVEVRALSGWSCLGPTTVLMIADLPGASLRHWPVYAVALAAQFVLDGASAAVRVRSLGVPLSSVAGSMWFTFGIDAMLAPVGLCAVIASDGSPALFVLVLAPLGLVRLLAQDRAEHEFGVLVVHPVEAGIEERLLAAVRRAMRARTCDVPLSMSLGAASWPPTSSLDEALVAADVAAATDKAMRRVGRTSATGPVSGDFARSGADS